MQDPFPLGTFYDHALGWNPKKPWIMKKSLQEFVVSLLHNKSPFPFQGLCFHAYKTLNVTEGMQCLNSSISFGSALGCSHGRQNREQGRSKMKETKSNAGDL